MNEETSDLPQAETADPDGVQVALRAAQTLWSRGDTTESLKWLRKAAESASDEGEDLRSLQLAKAAAELRAKLFGSHEPLRNVPPVVGGGDVSGAHPIAAPLAGADVEGASSVASMSSSSTLASQHNPDAYAGVSSAGSGGVSYASGSAGDDGGHGSPQPVVTATQYPSQRPSQRPRQRMGLSSPPPGIGGSRDGAYASVPSWSADSERRTASAPPPLPATDDYEELEAEPDDEPADDPGSVWTSGSDSWRPAEPAPQSALPPPLPPRGAFADDADFGQQPEPPTVVRPPLDESEVEARSNAVNERRAAGAFAVQANAWDQQARIPSWDPDAGSSWAAELRNGAWGNAGLGSSSLVTGSGVGADSVAGLGLEPTDLEPTSFEHSPQSETAPAKLTARVHHQAVRVSFAPDLRVPGQYVVRPLREGERAATGERIALLVALEPGLPLV